MAVEVFHNLHELKHPQQYAHLVLFDKFLLMRKGQDEQGLVDLFGARDNPPELVHLMTFDDREGERSVVSASASWLLETELGYLTNIADSYTLGYSDIEESCFRYRVSDGPEPDKQELLELIRQVARLQVVPADRI